LDAGHEGKVEVVRRPMRETASFCSVLVRLYIRAYRRVARGPCGLKCYVTKVI